MAKVMKSTKAKAKKPRKSASQNERPKDVVIREANRRLDALDRQAETLRDQRKVIVATLIKGELGMKSGDFMAARRLRAMDPEKRAGLFGAIRDQFGAMGERGGQVDFLKAMEEEDREIVADLKVRLDQTEEAAEAQGYQAGMDSASMADNGYPPKSKHYAAWDRGFTKALVYRLETGTTGQAATQ